MEYDIEMVRGDTYPFSIVIDGDTPDPEAITMTVKASPRRSADPVFQLSLGDGITATEDGYDVRIPPSATEELSEGIYYYDVEFSFAIDEEDDVYTPIRGKVKLLPDTTTPEDRPTEEET